MKADQRLKVAEIERAIAEQKKASDIAKGQGEAEARRLVLAADGALNARLTSWERVNGKYADAIGQYRGNLVPGVVMGSSTSSSSSVQDFINLQMLSTAKQLGLTSDPKQDSSSGFSLVPQPVTTPK